MLSWTNGATRRVRIGRCSGRSCRRLKAVLEASTLFTRCPFHVQKPEITAAGSKAQRPAAATRSISDPPRIYNRYWHAERNGQPSKERTLGGGFHEINPSPRFLRTSQRWMPSISHRQFRIEEHGLLVLHWRNPVQSTHNIRYRWIAQTRKDAEVRMSASLGA